MSQVNLSNQPQVGALFQELLTAGVGPKSVGDSNVPPIPVDDKDVISFINKNPELAAPLLAAGLALEVLMEALGSEERKTAVKTSTETLKAKADERKATNEKQLNEIKERLEKMAKQKTMNAFLKVFKIIGAVVGAIAAAATIAAGVITGNPLLIAGGVVLAVLAVDSVVGLASDGKYGIAQGVAAALKAMGVNENVAQWIGIGVTIAIAIVGAALSLGGAAVASGAAIVNTTAQTVTKAVSVTTNIIGALNTIAEGATGIAASVNQYDINKSHVRSKELEAILARLQEATEVEQEFLKTVLKKFEDMLAKISDLVKDNNETMTQVLGGDSISVPSPA